MILHIVAFIYVAICTLHKTDNNYVLDIFIPAMHSFIGTVA